ncbi:MAG: ABC transporter permease [Thermodesulfobacteriota bacterium]
MVLALGKSLKRSVEFKDLVAEFVKSDLKARYVGSTLGLYWSVINPILLLIIYTLVFSVILGVRFTKAESIQNYSLYLFCGMLPWIAFQESITTSVSTLTKNANLVRNVVFPLKTLHTSLVISALISELIGIVILLIFRLAITGTLGYLIPLLIIIIFFQFLFTMGFALLLSALNVFFRDVNPLMRPLIRMWMYLTPVFYPLTIVPEKVRIFIYINPMTSLVTAYRDILLNDRLPGVEFLYFVVFSIAIFVLGYRFFTKNHMKLVDLL